MRASRLSRRRALQGSLASAGIATVLALSLLGTPRAFAQEPPDATDTSPSDGSGEPTRDVAEPWTQTDDELAEQGWQFDDRSTTRGSAAGGLVALTLGSILHGAGHLYVGERRSAWRLAAGEGGALALWLAGGLVRGAADADESALLPVGSALTLLGSSLFLTSWSADVIGAFKGTASMLPVNTGEARGVSMEMFYSSLFQSGVGFSNVGIVRVPISARPFHLRPEVQISTGLEYTSLGVTGGWRQPVGSRRDTWFQLAATGQEEALRLDGGGSGRDRLGVESRISLDVGDVIPSLSGLVWQNAVEMSGEFYFFAADRNRRFRTDQFSWQLPCEASLGMNVNPGVNLTVGYRRRRDLLVGSGADTPGSYFERIVFVPRNNVGLELQAEQGAFFRVQIGLRWVLAGSRAGSGPRGGGGE